jgi:hypothetical protein
MSERETAVELPFAAGCCPCVGKLRTVLPLTAGIRDGAVQLVLTHQRGRSGERACGLCWAQNDSRMKAVERFPSLEPQLKRVKDHGRAEALLIASFGEAELRREAEQLAEDEVMPSREDK